jgi:hypothetical protein
MALEGTFDFHSGGPMTYCGDMKSGFVVFSKVIHFVTNMFILKSIYVRNISKKETVLKWQPMARKKSPLCGSLALAGKPFIRILAASDWSIRNMGILK